MTVHRYSGSWAAFTGFVFDATWTDDDDLFWAWDGATWRLIQPVPGSGALTILPVENLAVAPSYPTARQVVVTWDNPTPLSAETTPNETWVRVPELLGGVWLVYPYPMTTWSHLALAPSTFYTVEVLLARRDGPTVLQSPVRSVTFTTLTATVGPPGVGPGPGDTDVPVDPPGPGCTLEWFLQVAQPEIGWVQVATGTQSGSDTEVPLDDSLFTCGNVYRLCVHSDCGSGYGPLECGDPWLQPCDWGDPCAEGATDLFLSETMFDDAAFLVPLVCAPDIIHEVKSDALLAHGPIWGGIDNGPMPAPSYAMAALGSLTPEVVVYGTVGDLSVLTGDLSFAFMTRITAEVSEDVKVIELPDIEFGLTPSLFGGTTLYLQLARAGGTDRYEATTDLTLDDWLPCIVTFDADGDVRFYIDAEDVGTDTALGAGDAPLSDNLYISQPGDSLVTYLAGWDRVLTDAEIGTYRVSQRPRVMDDSLWWLDPDCHDDTDAVGYFTSPGTMAEQGHGIYRDWSKFHKHDPHDGAFFLCSGDKLSVATPTGAPVANALEVEVHWADHPGRGTTSTRLIGYDNVVEWVLDYDWSTHTLVLRANNGANVLTSSALPSGDQRPTRTFGQAPRVGYKVIWNGTNVEFQVSTDKGVSWTSISTHTGFVNPPSNTARAFALGPTSASERAALFYKAAISTNSGGTRLFDWDADWYLDNDTYPDLTFSYLGKTYTLTLDATGYNFASTVVDRSVLAVKGAAVSPKFWWTDGRFDGSALFTSDADYTMISSLESRAAVWGEGNQCYFYYPTGGTSGFGAVVSNNNLVLYMGAETKSLAGVIPSTAGHRHYALVVQLRHNSTPGGAPDYRVRLFYRYHGVATSVYDSGWTAWSGGTWPETGWHNSAGTSGASLGQTIMPSGAPSNWYGNGLWARELTDDEVNRAVTYLCADRSRAVVPDILPTLAEQAVDDGATYHWPLLSTLDELIANNDGTMLLGSESYGGGFKFDGSGGGIFYDKNVNVKLPSAILNDSDWFLEIWANAHLAYDPSGGGGVWSIMFWDVIGPGGHANYMDFEVGLGGNDTVDVNVRGSIGAQGLGRVASDVWTHFGFHLKPGSNLTTWECFTSGGVTNRFAPSSAATTVNGSPGDLQLGYNDQRDRWAAQVVAYPVLPTAQQRRRHYLASRWGPF